MGIRESQKTTLELQGEFFTSVFPEPIDSVINEEGEVVIDNAGLFNTKWNITGLGEHDLGVVKQTGLQENGNNVSFLGIEHSYQRNSNGSLKIIDEDQIPFVKQGSEGEVASNFFNGFDPLTGAPDLHLSGNVRVTTNDQEILIEGLGKNDFFFVDAYHKFNPSLDITFEGFEHGVVINTSGLDSRFVDGYVDSLNETNEDVQNNVFPDFL